MIEHDVPKLSTRTDTETAKDWELTQSAPPAPKTDGSGKPVDFSGVATEESGRAAPSECTGPRRDRREAHRGSDRSCQHEVKRFAKRLLKLFAAEIASDPRAFKKRAIETLKRSLPPYPGRPTEQAITQAAILRGEGREWPEVYRLVIADHRHLDPATRRLAESNLRSAIRSRRNARKRRNVAGRSLAQTTRPPNVPLSETAQTALTLDGGKATEDAHPRTTPIPQG